MRGAAGGAGTGTQVSLVGCGMVVWGGVVVWCGVGWCGVAVPQWE